MNSTASVRDLRNRFPAVRRIVETHGEVILTESGQPKYRLALYAAPTRRTPPKIDYWARLISRQPEPISAVQAKALQEENRGDR